MSLFFHKHTYVYTHPKRLHPATKRHLYINEITLVPAAFLFFSSALASNGISANSGEKKINLHKITQPMTILKTLELIEFLHIRECVSVFLCHNFDRIIKCSQ